MPQLRLATDGDGVEQTAYSTFLPGSFPAYELFWQSFVVPLTNRPQDIHFITDAKLKAIGKSQADLCIAQLHYSVLVHLNQSFVVFQKTPMSLAAIVESFVRLTGALDNAFELLERFTNKSKYDPGAEQGPRGGKSARRNWQTNHSHPLQTLRDYRNTLVHGRLLPSISNAGVVSLPVVGKQDQYLDWRLITDPANNPGAVASDYQSGDSIVKQAFQQVCDYLEREWRAHLLAGSTATLAAIGVPAVLNAPASGSFASPTVSGMTTP